MNVTCTGALEDKLLNMHEVHYKEMKYFESDENSLGGWQIKS